MYALSASYQTIYYQIQSNLVVSWQEQRRSESNYLGTGFGAVGHTVAAIPQRKSVD